nr:unnamed protein product [Callosobruchus chinensis]
MMSLSYLFRVGKSTVSNIISETLDEIWNVLQPLVLVARNREEWKKAAEGFEAQWNFPNCIGAIDGKHVWIQAPPHAGSSYYNYKGNHSIILMAVVNHQYEFLLVDIGGQGRQSDGGIFRESSIGQKLANKTLDIPEHQVIADGRPPLRFAIVGDEAFSLLESLMRPYPGQSQMDIEKRIYNYKHSRARRLSKNAFGILAAQWRIFAQPIIGKVINIENTIKASVCLHNFLIKYVKHSYTTPALVDREQDGVVIQGTWRDTPSQLTPVRQLGANMYRRNAKDIRDTFKSYFNEEGAIPWQ